MKDKMIAARAAQLEKALQWAKDNEQIRAMLLTSSMVNPGAPLDEFSDLDIEWVIADLPAFLADDSWLSNFGEVVSYIVENEEAFEGRHAMRMVFYADYTKIDFKLYAADKFMADTLAETLPEDWDVGYKVLLDKDGITRHMKPPTYQSVLIKKPSEEHYQWVLNNYWWDLTYVVKCLWRCELFYAKFMSEQIMRFEHLQHIIEWYIGMQHDWKVTTNKYGRLFRQYLSPELWHRVEQTFAGADLQDNWRALEAYVSLGRELGMAIAAQLGYRYPHKLDEQISRYVETIKQLPPKEQKSIYGT